MKFDVSKKARTAEKNTVSPSFFVEGEQLQKREEPLDVPSFMHRAPAGAKPSGTTVQKDAENSAVRRIRQYIRKKGGRGRLPPLRIRAGPIRPTQRADGNGAEGVGFYTI